MKALIVCLCLVVTCVIHTSGQETYELTGVVKDTNGNPVPGTIIRLNAPPRVVATDNNGQFSLSSLPKGEYSLHASFVGYIAYNDSVQLNRNLRLSITLRPDIVNLDEVVVLEKNSRVRNKNEVLSLEVVHKDFIIENDAGNLIKTIEKLPGVYSMDIGSGISKPVIRGMGFNRVVVSENGIKQEGQQWGADHGLELDQYNVDKMEIYKGPMSLQYGSDAIGGVLEIVPVQMPRENKAFGDVVLIGKSNNNLLGVSAMAGVSRKRWNTKIRVTEQHFGDYKIPTDTIVYLTRPLPVYHNRLKNTAGFERNVSSQLTYNGDKFSVGVRVSNVYQKNGFFPGSHGIPDLSRVSDDGKARNIDSPNSSVNHFKAIVNSSLKVGDWKGSLDVAFQDNHREEWANFHTHYSNQTPPAVDPDLELELKLKTYSANLRFESGATSERAWKHTFGVTGDYQENGIGGYNFLLPRFDRTTLGAFFVESYKINEKLKLTGGARFDYGQLKIDAFRDTILEEYLNNMGGYTASEVDFYSQRSYGIKRQFSDLTWSAGLVFNPNEKETYKVNVGRSFRLPGAHELASNGVHHGTFRHELGDTALNSEKGYQLDVAYFYSGCKFSFSLNPFVGWFSNYIYLNPTGEWSVLPHAGQIYKYSQAEALVTGAECTVNYELLKDITLETNLEYVYLKNLTDGYPLPFSPPLSIFNSITWHKHKDNKVIKDFHLALEHHFVARQDRIARNEDVTPGSNIFGLSLNNTWALGGFSFMSSFQIQNMFNQKYFNHLSFYRKLNIPEPGRNFQIIIRIPIN
ncbi:MAG TPA: TonB-dependent receptor [Bacteroidales bacterium]|nr:TonB-dependent receptor [Bacteroidales bacterium]